MRSTSDESSVPIKPSAIAAAWARFMASTLKICGVCAAQYSSRGGVSTMLSPSTILSVSMAGWPHTTPSRARSLTSTSIAWSIASVVMSGRAPSWMATYSKPAGTACTPARVESWRVSPASAKLMGVLYEYGLMARRRISARRSAGQTTTMWPTLLLRSNARMDQLISGRPATLTSCLPPGLPKRWPLPPATTTAHTGAIMRSPVWCPSCGTGSPQEWQGC